MTNIMRRIFILLTLTVVVSFIAFYSSQQRYIPFTNLRVDERLQARQERMLEVTREMDVTTGPHRSVDTTRRTTSTIISSTTSTISSTIPTSTTSSTANCPNGPIQNLMFLKTHKTGSSTVQNVLVRHAYNNGLFIGLPSGDILFRYIAGASFRRGFMQKTPVNRTVNMLVHHMVFNKKEVAAVLPSDTLYFTILRDPATQFESLFKYMLDHVKAFKRVPRGGGMREYLTNPLKYFKGRQDGITWWFGKNNYMYDLGFNNTNETDAYIQETIEEIDKTFKFVLISEYFDISLILLKELLCWDMKDIVYLSMNARNQSTVEEVTPDVKDLAYKWNKADTDLYTYYNKTFWQRVEKYGKVRLEKDLLDLQRLKNETAHFCVEDEVQNNKDVKDKNLKMFNPKNIEIGQYKLKPYARNNLTCLGMIMPEKSWYDKISLRQYPRVIVKKPVATKTFKNASQNVGKSKVIIGKPSTSAAMVKRNTSQLKPKAVMVSKFHAELPKNIDAKT